MKRVLSLTLSIILALSAIMAVPFSAQAEDMHTEIKFTVENTSGSTFTITRSATGIQQTVRYRTVSMTAIASVHFTEATGNLTFGVNDTSKTVTVTETAYSNVTGADRYQTASASRYYRFEVLNSIGQIIASCKRTLTSYTSNVSTNSYSNRVHKGDFNSTVRLADARLDGEAYDSIDSNKIYTIRNYLKDISVCSNVTVTDAGYAQGVHSVSTSPIFSYVGVNQEYLNAAGAKLYLKPYMLMHEDIDCYEYIQILVDNENGCDTGAGSGKPGTISASAYMCGFEHDSGTSSYYSFPYRTSNSGYYETEYTDENNFVKQLVNTSLSCSIDDTSGALVVPVSAQTISFRLNASGSGDDKWTCESLTLRGMVVDKTAPSVRGAAISQGSYYNGQKMTVAVLLNEVVKAIPYTMNTTFGDFFYTGTNGTNVAVYEGIVNANSGTTFRITGFDYSTFGFKDLADNVSTPSYTKTFTGTTCQGYQTAQSLGGVYQISNYNDLCFFLNYAASNPGANAILLNDIDVNPDGEAYITLAQLGTNSNGYLGTFDGNGHTISGLYLDNSSFASKLGTTGVIKDLEIVPIKHYFKSGVNSLLCKENYGTIQGCRIHGFSDSTKFKLTYNMDCIGIVAGTNYGTVNNCIVLDSFDIDKNSITGLLPSIGGIVGCNYGTVENSVFAGEITLPSSYNGHVGTISYRNESNATVDNCYGLYTAEYDFNPVYNNNSDAILTNSEKVTATQLASGEVTYKLNSGVTDGTQVWYQNIDNNETPDTLPQYSGGTVYTHGTIYTNDNFHHIELVPAVAPTCEDTGTTAYYHCAVEGCTAMFSDANGENPITLQSVTIPAIGHNWGEPTYVWFKTDNDEQLCIAQCKCTNDSTHKKNESNYATLTASTEPTCTQPGTKTYTVTFNDPLFETQTTTEEDEDAPATGHSPNDIWDSDDDYHWHECFNCGEQLDKGSHVWVDEFVAIEPTCTTDGERRFTCWYCGDEMYETIPAAHTYTAVVTPASIDSQGYTTYTCSVCGDTYVGDYTTAEFTFQIYEDEGYAVVAGYNGTAVDIIIPSVTGDNYPVKRIKNDVFKNSDLHSVVIPEGVVFIGSVAFSGCTNLEYATLPSTLKNIGPDAFRYTALKHIDIPEGVETIGNYAFSESGLLDIVIPDSVTFLGQEAFSRCTSLTSATVGSSVPSLKSMFMDCEKLEEITIKGTETTAEYATFHGLASINTITIPCSYDKSKLDSDYSHPSELFVNGDEFTVYCGGTAYRTGSFVYSHTYSEPAYTWAADNSTVTASAQCDYCEEQSNAETVNTTVGASTATCTQGGAATYYAEFENGAFAPQSKTVDVPALGHSWSAQWEWNGITSATATLTCARCDSTYTGQAEITQNGNMYTANLTHDGKTFTASYMDGASFISLGDNSVDVAAGDNYFLFFAPETAEYDFEILTESLNIYDIYGVHLYDLNGNQLSGSAWRSGVGPDTQAELRAGELCKLYFHSDAPLTEIPINVSKNPISEDAHMFYCDSNLGSNLVNCYSIDNATRLLSDSFDRSFILSVDIPEGYYISSVDFTDKNGNAIANEDMLDFNSDEEYYFYYMPDTDLYIYVTFAELSDNNQWGDNITWSYDEDYGIVTLSGTGAVPQGSPINGYNLYSDGTFYLARFRFWRRN